MTIDILAASSGHRNLSVLLIRTSVSYCVLEITLGTRVYTMVSYVHVRV